MNIRYDIYTTLPGLGTRNLYGHIPSIIHKFQPIFLGHNVGHCPPYSSTRERNISTTCFFTHARFERILQPARGMSDLWAFLWVSYPGPHGRLYFAIMCICDPSAYVHVSSNWLLLGLGSYSIFSVLEEHRIFLNLNLPPVLSLNMIYINFIFYTTTN